MQAKKGVLVVDDNEINRMLLDKMLADDYYIIHAENGVEALKILDNPKNQIEAVLLDIVMPQMNGYEFLEIIRKKPGFMSLPIVVMTENEDERNEIKALELGATDFLVKPYKPTIVKQRLKNLLTLNDAAALRNTSQRDPRSGLYNREAFYRKSKRLITENLNVQYNIMCVDIERFKIINDLFGIREGNRILRYIGKTISDNLDPLQGISGRLTADNFAICYIEHPGFEEKMMYSLRESLKTYPLDTKIIVRFGIFQIENANVPVSTMCDRANLAIATIKGNYQRYYAYYNETHRSYLLEEQTITNDMHAALMNKQFKVYFQPKYNIRNHEIVGAEALIRWQHPKKGMLSPGSFIPIFEKNGFITNVDVYMWEEVSKWLRAWIDQGYEPIPVSVNVSRVDIYNPDLCSIIEEIVERYDVPKRLLELEITETAYTENPEQLIQVVDKLKKLDFNVQMDDFGTGYSSLNMLNDVPVDVLKIDMKFIQNSRNNSRGASILKFIIDLAKRMNLDIVAEGIETAEQVNYLRKMGCMKGQGFYFAKPMPLEEFTEKLKKIQDDLKIAGEGYVYAAGLRERVRQKEPEVECRLQSLEKLNSWMPQGIICFSLEDGYPITNYNKTAWELLGFQNNNEFEKKISRGMGGLIEANDYADMLAHIKDGDCRKQRISFRHRFFRSDGSEGYMEGSYVADVKTPEIIYIFELALQ